MKTRKQQQILKRHVGLPVKFHGFNDRTYSGQLIDYRNGIFTLRYKVEEKPVLTYLDRKDARERVELND